MSGPGRALGLPAALLCIGTSPAAYAQAESSVSTSTTGTTSIELPDLTGSQGPSYAVTVRRRRLPRHASDLQFDFDPRHAAGAGQSGADALSRAPGVVITQHSGEGKAHQIFLRGFDAVHGQDVEIHVGGIPVNEPSHVHGQGYADLHFLIAESLQRLRVLEGPFSPRQGDFAMAGSFDLDLGLSRRGLLARTSVGSFGLMRGLVAWGPRQMSEATFLAAEIGRTDGFGPARAAERAAAAGQAELELGAGWLLRALASTYRGRFDSAGVLRLEDEQAGRVGFLDASFPGQGGESERHQALLELRFETTRRRASLASYLVRRDLALRQNFTGFLLDPSQGDMNEQSHGSWTFGGRAQYREHALLPGLGLDGGFVWRHDRSIKVQRRLAAQDHRPYATEIDAALALTDLGLYGELEWTPHASWTLRAGARGELLLFSVQDALAPTTNPALADRRSVGARLLPRASLSWQPGERFEFFVAYGQGFRSPEALSLADGEAPTFTLAHAGELGGRWTPSEAWALTLAAFSTYVDRELQFDHASGTTLPSGATLRAGGTALLRARLAPGVELDLAGTYTHSRNLDQQTPVAFAPGLVLRAELHAERQLGRWDELPLVLFGRSELLFVGLKPLPYSEQAAPVLGSELSMGIGLGPVSLSVELYNLFNLRWRDGEFVYASRFAADTPSSLVPARHFTAGRPFTAQLSLSMEL